MSGLWTRGIAGSVFRASVQDRKCLSTWRFLFTGLDNRVAARKYLLAYFQTVDLVRDFSARGRMTQHGRAFGFMEPRPPHFSEHTTECNFVPIVQAVPESP